MSEKTLGQELYEHVGGTGWDKIPEPIRQEYEDDDAAVIAAYREQQRANVPDLVARCRQQLASHPAWQTVNALLKEVVDVLTATAETKPAKTRGQIERERFVAACDSVGVSIAPTAWDATGDDYKAGWEAYAATLPPRPTKTPGERLSVALSKHALFAPWDELNEKGQRMMDAAARDLGIQECEA